MIWGFKTTFKWEKHVLTINGGDAFFKALKSVGSAPGTAEK
jgi:hypothetical protein